MVDRIADLNFMMTSSYPDSSPRLWRCGLALLRSVTIRTDLHQDGDDILAATHGEMFSLDARSGTIKWKNPRPGMGRGLITIAGSPGNWAPIAQQQQDEHAQAAAATGAPRTG
jgi:hypothetical protein